MQKNQPEMEETILVTFNVRTGGLLDPPEWMKIHPTVIEKPKTKEELSGTEGVEMSQIRKAAFKNLPNLLEQRGYNLQKVILRRGRPIFFNKDGKKERIEIDSVLLVYIQKESPEKMLTDEVQKFVEGYYRRVWGKIKWWTNEGANGAHSYVFEEDLRNHVPKSLPAKFLNKWSDLNRFSEK